MAGHFTMSMSPYLQAEGKPLYFARELLCEEQSQGVSEPGDVRNMRLPGPALKPIGCDGSM